MTFRVQFGREETTVTTYDVSLEHQKRLAQAQFEQLVNNGRMAVAKVGEELEVVTELPEDATEVVFLPRFVGG